MYKRNEEADTRQQASQSPNERESVYADLNLSNTTHVTKREPVYTGLNLSNDAQITDARSDNSTTENYDYITQMN